MMHALRFDNSFVRDLPGACYSQVAPTPVVAPHLVTYAARLVLATHANEGGAPPSVRQYVRHGASPRGLQAMVAGAQVRALLEDRFNISREDLHEVASLVLDPVVVTTDGLAVLGSRVQLAPPVTPPQRSVRSLPS